MPLSTIISYQLTALEIQDIVEHSCQRSVSIFDFDPLQPVVLLFHPRERYNLTQVVYFFCPSCLKAVRIHFDYVCLKIEANNDIVDDMFLYDVPCFLQVT